MPFDNLQKRLAFAKGAPATLPCATPEEFFARYLTQGTGATCWPSSAAFHALLRVCGFDAIRLTGTIEGYEGINHGSVLVRVAGNEFLVDTWVASEVALPLTRVVTSASVGAYRVRAEPFCPFWRVWRPHPARDEEHYFEVKERNVGIARVLDSWPGIGHVAVAHDAAGGGGRGDLVLPCPNLARPVGHVHRDIYIDSPLRPL